MRVNWPNVSAHLFVIVFSFAVCIVMHTFYAIAIFTNYYLLRRCKWTLQQANQWALNESIATSVKFCTAERFHWEFEWQQSFHRTNEGLIVFLGWVITGVSIPLRWRWRMKYMAWYMTPRKRSTHTSDLTLGMRVRVCFLDLEIQFVMQRVADITC